jgi:parallel beta-helix repeat protein
MIGVAVGMTFSSTTATIVGTPKPASGDWEISDATTLTDETIEFAGNIIVASGGSLTLTGTTLKFNCAKDGDYGITVNSGGALTITGDSHITKCGDGNYLFIVEKGATFSMDGSKVEYVGYNIGDGYDDNQGWKKSGIYIACDGTITNSTIDNCLQGLVCEGNTFTIKDSTVQNSLWHNFEGRATKNFVIDNCQCINSVEKCNVEFYAGCTGALKNSVVEGAGHNGVWCMTDNVVTIENNDISGAPYNGIWAADNSDITITGNTVHDNDCSGIWIEQNSKVTCTGNTIKENGDPESETFKAEDEAGMRPGHGFAGFDSEVIFNENTVGDNYGHNFETTNCTTTFNDNTFSKSIAKCNVEFYEGSVVTAKRNIIDGAGHNCFWIRDDVVATIEDNELRNSPHNGIWAGINCKLTIRNNLIEKCAESGIYAFNCTLTIENNEIKDCGWYGIQTEGGSVTKKDNTITECDLGVEFRGLWTTVSAVDKDNSALLDAVVTVKDADGAMVWTGKTGADGNTNPFLLDQTKTYTLEAEWGDAKAEEDFAPDGATTSLSLKLEEEEETDDNTMIFVAVVVILLIVVIIIIVVVVMMRKKPPEDEDEDDKKKK